MNADFDRPTAKIYQFPTAKMRNRRFVNAIQGQNAAQPAISANYDFRAWYHEEAVKAERSAPVAPRKY